jgi:hypothetical protein
MCCALCFATLSLNTAHNATTHKHTQELARKKAEQKQQRLDTAAERKAAAAAAAAARKAQQAAAAAAKTQRFGECEHPPAVCAWRHLPDTAASGGGCTPSKHERPACGHT